MKTELGQAEAEKAPGPAETTVASDRSEQGLEGVGGKRLGREFKTASLQGRLGEAVEERGVGRVTEVVGGRRPGDCGGQRRGRWIKPHQDRNR